MKNVLLNTISKPPKPPIFFLSSCQHSNFSLTSQNIAVEALSLFLLPLTFFSRRLRILLQGLKNIAVIQFLLLFVFCIHNLLELILIAFFHKKTLENILRCHPSFLHFFDIFQIFRLGQTNIPLVAETMETLTGISSQFCNSADLWFFPLRMTISLCYQLQLHWNKQIIKINERYLDFKTPVKGFNRVKKPIKLI